MKQTTFFCETGGRVFGFLKFRALVEATVLVLKCPHHFDTLYRMMREDNEALERYRLQQHKHIWKFGQNRRRIPSIHFVGLINKDCNTTWKLDSQMGTSKFLKSKDEAIFEQSKVQEETFDVCDALQISERTI